VEGPAQDIAGDGATGVTLAEGCDGIADTIVDRALSESYNGSWLCDEANDHGETMELATTRAEPKTQGIAIPLRRRDIPHA
jgi:hypothetical protein